MQALIYIFKMSNKKQIFKINYLKKLLSDKNSCVSLVSANRLLALPPIFLNDMKSGILYLLNTMLKKYDRSLDGIVIGYQNIKVLMDENTGNIPIGTPETEVNISVEFYIFQPRIGSFLEGVVNKKSNNHIGCLVHRYFNATILKPDDVDHDAWICQNFNVDDKIIFEVKDLDFTSLLPRIEGIIDDERLLGKIKCNLNGNCDIGSDTVNDVNEQYQSEVSLIKEFSQNGKNNDDDNLSKLEDNVNRNPLEIDSFLDSRKKKKKKKKEEKDLPNSLGSSNQSEKEISSSDREFMSVTFNKESNLGEKYYMKKNRKKDKKEQEEETEDVRNTQKSSTSAENVTKEDNSRNRSILEKLSPVESDSTNDFVKPRKHKKEKKKKKIEQEESYMQLNNTNQCLLSKEVEENIFCSTQLDLVLPKKMRISLCSPIPRDEPLEEKSPKKDFNLSTLLKNHEKDDERKKKHKSKKRKREEEMEPEIISSPKKIKTSDSYLGKESIKNLENKGEGGSTVRKMIEELCRQHLDRIEDKESLKERKEKEEKSKNEEKEIPREESLNLNKNKKEKVNEEVGGVRNSQEQSLLDELRKQEMQRMKEVLNISDGEKSKERKKAKVKGNKKERKVIKEKERKDSFGLKKNTKTQLNGRDNGEKKFLVQNMMDQLFKQEINSVKEDYEKSVTKSFQEEKKPNEVINKGEPSKKKTHDSLFEKLLKEAKSALDFEKRKPSILSPVKESGKKKKKDLFNSSVSSFETKSSGEKRERSHKKTKSCHQTPEKYKNGNMYDVVPICEKVNFDKSLFSDSEESHSSPAKGMNKVNGTDAGFPAQESFKKETGDVKNRSSKKKEKKSNKSSEQKSEIKCSSEEQESLYEKLLREAKSLVHCRIDSTPKKGRNV